VISGIPQGTVLGLLLFLIYINDLCDMVNNCEIALFADDAKLYKAVKTVNVCLDMSDDILNIESWIEEWQMRINISKCELLRIGYNNLSFPYKVGNINISAKPSCRDLAVNVSNDFSFSDHCNKIARTAHFRRRQFQQSFACKEIDFQVYLFCTYIRSLVEHNSVIWSPHLLQDIDKVEDVQRKFTKYLQGLYNVTYLQRLDYLGIESLELRRNKKDLVYVYKIINSLVECDLNDFFTFNYMSTRGHNLKINIQFSRVNCRKYIFVNRAAPIWNNLDASIVNCRTLQKFKCELDKCNLQRYCRGRAYSVS